MNNIGKWLFIVVGVFSAVVIFVLWITSGICAVLLKTEVERLLCLVAWSIDLAVGAFAIGLVVNKKY